MQKTKKQILGIAGLLAVGVMTTIACSLPAPDAAAIDASSAGDVNINVNIQEGNTRIQLVKPLDGSAFVDSSIEVSSNYEDASKLEYYLSYTKDDGTEEEVNVRNQFVQSGTSGTDTFTLDLNPYGYRKLKLRAVAYGAGSTTREDSVAFDYSAIIANFQGIDKNGDPILNTEVSEKVEQVRVQVYDKNGKPLFVNANGQEEPVLLNRSAIDPATGKNIISALPFGKYGAAPGEYTAVISAYDASSNIISMVTLDTKYAIETPDTPNTGSTLFGNLNISRLDYLLTGLIAFGIAAGFAVYLVQRKNRR